MNIACILTLHIIIIIIIIIIIEHRPPDIVCIIVCIECQIINVAIPGDQNIALMAGKKLQVPGLTNRITESLKCQDSGHTGKKKYKYYYYCFIVIVTDAFH